MSRPDTGHCTVTAKGGVLELRIPVDLVTSLAGVKPSASDQSLRARLPKFGPELANGLTQQLAEPSSARDPQRIRVVKILLTRVVVIGETNIELDAPAEVYT